MRIASASLILTVSLLHLACGDTGGETDGTTAGPSSSLPTLPTNPSASETGSETGTPTDSGEPTGGTMSGTSATDPTTGDGTTGSTGPVDPTTTTDATTTNDPSVGTSTGGTPCEELKATLMPIQPNVMLVLDKSGSMVANPNGFWDHDADVNTPNITRWNSLYQVVQTLVNDYNETINFGANLFPSTSAKLKYDATACVVNAAPEIMVAPMNKDAILNGIPQAGDTSLVGGTPSAAGVAAAIKHLKTLDAAIPRAIILVTDGAANCATGVQPPPLFEAYDQTLHTLVSDAFTVDNIPTYVVGIDTKNVVSPVMQDGNPDGVNTYEKLNELAVQGGKPKDDPAEKFYNAVNQIQLKAALDAIAADAVSCTIPLVSEPGFPEETKVIVGDTEYPMVTDCATEDGWVYDNPMGPYTAVILCGAACEALKVEKAADVEYYCEAG
jgi:hypothetical protein